MYNVAVFGGGAVVRCSALLLGATLIFGTVRSLVWAGLAQALLQSGFLLWYLRSSQVW